MVLGCTLPPVWLVPTGVYLVKFLIGNLSYSPHVANLAVQSFSRCNVHTTPATRLNTSRPLYSSILLLLHGDNSDDKTPYFSRDDVPLRKVLMGPLVT